MAQRSSRRFAVELLEERRLLSGGKAGLTYSVTPPVAPIGEAMPYAELTIKGHFTANAPTTVIFSGKNRTDIAVVPSSVTSTRIVVAVPAFFNPKSGQPVSQTAAVSVHQTVGDRGKNVQAIKGLSIAPLPATGLPAGALLDAVTVAAATVTSQTVDNFSHLGADYPTFGVPLRETVQATINATGMQIASKAIADLVQIGQLIPQAQQLLDGLGSSSVGQVPLGAYRGQPANLDANQLGLLDRIIAAGVDDAAGKTSKGPALIASLNNLVSGAISAGPDRVIARAINVVDVLSTALGNPVVPPGSVVTGLVLGSLSAVVAAAEAESQILQSAFIQSRSIGLGEISLIDRALDDPALGQSLDAITSGLVPTSSAGAALMQAALLAEDLGAQIDPNVAGSEGNRVAAYLKTVPVFG